MPLIPKHFISEPIIPSFAEPPMLEKAPPCPDAFEWRGELWRVAELLEEWVDFGRRGRMKRSMRPERLAVAANRGSLGVGRYHFRVRAYPLAQPADTHLFELYYDRAILNADQRKGTWMLHTELEQGA